MILWISYKSIRKIYGIFTEVIVRIVSCTRKSKEKFPTFFRFWAIIAIIEMSKVKKNMNCVNVFYINIIVVTSDDVKNMREREKEILLLRGIIKSEINICKQRVLHPD